MGIGINHYGESNVHDVERTSGKEIDAVANKQSGSGAQEETGGSGSVGSLRVIVDGNTPYIEVKSEKGWIRSDNTSTSGFSFKK